MIQIFKILDNKPVLVQKNKPVESITMNSHLILFSFIQIAFDFFLQI